MKQITKRLVISALLFCLFFIIGCSDEGDEDSSGSSIRWKLGYATSVQFDARMLIDEEVVGVPIITSPSFARQILDASRSEGDPISSDIYYYADLIFVYSEEEALQLPDNVIAAWPSTRTLGVINGLNWALQSGEVYFGERNSDGEIDLSEFSLEFPITLTDVVENWESVFDLWRTVSGGVKRLIEDEPRERHAEAFSEELIQLAKERSEELPEANISQNDIVFADRFNFSFRMVAESEIISSPAIILAHTQVFYPEFDPFYIDFVLVETKEEALLLPGNIIAAWPSQETHEKLNALNWILQGNTVVTPHDSVISDFVEDINAEDFSLQFPIITSDMIEQQEGFLDLWNALESATTWEIRNPASNSRREANTPEFLAELERLKEQRESESSE